jgi:predicted nucleic acid-binding protein
VTQAAPASGLLDTSVFIATESGRQLDQSLVPAEVATTVITLAELNAGVLAASTSDIRAQRLATLESVADIEALPVDEDAARMWARLRIHLAETGGRVRINDLWIAAIATSRTLPVITQDDDFDALEGVSNLTVIRV